jgi:transcriptional regulator with XRE-family HTH domain
MHLQAIPTEIASRRVERGLNKSELARIAKVNQCLVSRAEQGGRLSPKTAKALAGALDSKVLELFVIIESNSNNEQEST